jgi:hypothetical protein
MRLRSIDVLRNVRFNNPDQELLWHYAVAAEVLRGVQTRVEPQRLVLYAMTESIDERTRP